MTKQFTQWLAETTRATFFCTVIGRPDVRQWWAEVAGRTNDNLLVTEGPPGHASAQGEIEDGQLQLHLVCQPSRVDWLFSRVVSGFGTGSTAGGGTRLFEGSQPVPDSISALHAAVSTWIPKAPPSIRLAVGCTAHIPVSNREEGYLLLQNYLPDLRIDAIGSSDLSYQINRPRSSKILNDTSSVNRLSQWAVTAINIQAVQMGVVQTPQLMKLIATSGLYCRATVDVSTAAERSEIIEIEKLSSLFKELCDLAIELYERGDTP